MKKEDLEKLAKLAESEIKVVVSTLKEKGAERFGKAFAVAGLLVAAAYFGVYSPPKSKITMLQRRLDQRKVVAAYASQYKDLRDQLAVYYRQLPSAKDGPQWLPAALYDSMRAQNITPVSVASVVTSENFGLAVQMIPIQLNVKFPEFYAWLLSIDNSKPVIHLQLLEMSKASDKIGQNMAVCQLVTVTATKRYN